MGGHHLGKECFFFHFAHLMPKGIVGIVGHEPLYLPSGTRVEFLFFDRLEADGLGRYATMYFESKFIIFVIVSRGEVGELFVVCYLRFFL